MDRSYSVAAISGAHVVDPRWAIFGVFDPR